MPTDIVQQIADIGKAPGPFLIFAAAVAGGVWRLMKWRYEAIIEGLEHRLRLRDDTIARHGIDEQPKLASNISTSGDRSAASSRSPVQPAAKSLRNKPSTHNDTRQFVAKSVKPIDLRLIYEGKTAIQADQQAELYIGKWIRVEGVVQSAYRQGQDGIRLHLLDDPSDSIGLKGLWLTFDTHRTSLETLKVGDLVVATGEITSISKYDIEIEHCEIIDQEAASQLGTQTIAV